MAAKYLKVSLFIVLSFILIFGVSKILFPNFVPIIFTEKNENLKSHPYLLKAKGPYGVGYKDVYLTNTEICPDIFYKKNFNESDFRNDNDLYCHEIALRVYYPSHNQPGPTDKYYAPYLIARFKWLEMTHQLSEQDKIKLHSLQDVKIYASANASPIHEMKFPIILFMPGAGMAAQAYTNYITHLVSNGYIVIGVNSIFINGGLHLPNGRMVMPPDSYVDEQGRQVNLSDLKFVLKHIKKIGSQLHLKDKMDFSHMGLTGHSRGGMSIVNMVKENGDFKEIKAIILLDPGNLLKEKNYPIPPFNLPALTIWSSKFKIDLQGSVLLGKDAFEVTLKPKKGEDTFSSHLNFSDDSTLQLHPAYHIPNIDYTDVGKGDGYQIATAINDYALAFLDTYLKKKPDKVLGKCQILNEDTILRCGKNS